MSSATLEADTPALHTSPSTLLDAVRVFFRHGSPRILLVLAASTTGVRLLLGGFGLIDLLVVVAIVALWPIQEWLIHVFILHFEPKTVFGRAVDLRVAQKHRAHHRDPWRIDLVFIPLHVYPLSIPVHFMAWLLLMPTLALGFTGLAFFLLMALHYEWVHYIVHTRYKPRTAYYQRLWRNHRLHHNKNEKYWMGVTMLGGDRLLGTAPDPKSVELSPTARTLGQEV